MHLIGTFLVLDTGNANPSPYSTGERQVITNRRPTKMAVHPEEVADPYDLHRHFVDDIEVWIDDDKTIKGKRIPEGFDCWVESGSMPYASRHYPFENKQVLKKPIQLSLSAGIVANSRLVLHACHVGWYFRTTSGRKYPYHRHNLGCLTAVNDKSKRISRSNGSDWPLWRR